jgi:hypothetical protein
MSEETLNLETLAERLDVVEKYNLRFKRLGIGIALLGILGGFLGGVISAKIFQIQKTAMPSKVIEAEEICLLDQHGKKRIAMALLNDKPALMFLGENAEVPILLTVNKNGSPELFFSYNGSKYPSIIIEAEKGVPRLLMNDKNGQGRIMLAMGQDESSGLNFYNKDGESRISIGNDKTDSANIKLDNGKCGIGMILSPAGSPGLGLVDKNGKFRTLLTLDDGKPSIMLRDEKGISRAVLGSVELVNKSTGTETKRSLSSLVFFDDTGDVIWKAPPNN